MAALIDYDTDIINSDTLAIREIEYHYYKFYFYTYSDKFLQYIQIYFISSELEQAAGRSRLLNNKNTIHAYSCFPLKQAEFIETE